MPWLEQTHACPLGLARPALGKPFALRRAVGLPGVLRQWVPHPESLSSSGGVTACPLSLLASSMPCHPGGWQHLSPQGGPVHASKPSSGQEGWRAGLLAGSVCCGSQ